MIAQLNPRNLGPAVRAANENLLAAFINADLPSRVGLDSRKSVVFYDQSFRCVYALDGLPNERTLRKLYHQTPVRYWSKAFDMTDGIPCEECHEQPASGDAAGGRALCSDCIEDHPADNDRA